MRTLTLEKEKSNSETHKAELDQVVTKSKIEIEKIKEKYHNELNQRTNEYETKLTELNLRLVYLIEP